MNTTTEPTPLSYTPDPSWAHYMKTLREQVCAEVLAEKAKRNIDHQATESDGRNCHYVEPFEVHGVEWGQDGAYQTHKGQRRAHYS